MNHFDTSVNTRSARNHAIVTLYEAGWTTPMIAALTGLALATVWRALRYAGVPIRGRWG